MSVLNLRGGNDTATADNIRIGKRLLVVWVKEGGIILPSPAGFTFMRKISDLQQISDIAAEFLNERDIFESGSKSLPTSDGVNTSATMTLEGDAMEEVASLIGQAIRTYPSIEGTKDYGRCGHIVMYSFDEDNQGKVTDVLFDVGIKLANVPGTSDAEITRTITMYTKQGINAAHVWGDTGVSEGGVPSFEIYYDNGVTITNAAAPDGILTSFILGFGNESYATPAAPAILQINTTASTNLYKYLYFCRVDGVDVNPNDCSFDPILKTLEFTVPPANGAKLEVAYLVDRAGGALLGQPAHLHGTTAFSGSNQLFNWKTAQRGA